MLVHFIDSRTVLVFICYLTGWWFIGEVMSFNGTLCFQNKNKGSLLLMILIMFRKKTTYALLKLNKKNNKLH